MGFINKIVDVVTGKTALERKQEKFAMQQIRKDVMAAQLRERRTQAVKYAQELERLKYKKKLQELKKPKINIDNYNLIPQGNKNYGSILSYSPQSITSKNKSKKRSKSQIMPKQKYDVLGI